MVFCVCGRWSIAITGDPDKIKVVSQGQCNVLDCMRAVNMYASEMCDFCEWLKTDWNPRYKAIVQNSFPEETLLSRVRTTEGHVAYLSKNRIALEKWKMSENPEIKAKQEINRNGIRRNGRLFQNADEVLPIYD